MRNFLSLAVGLTTICAFALPAASALPSATDVIEEYALCLEWTDDSKRCAYVYDDNEDGVRCALGMDDRDNSTGYLYDFCLSHTH